MRCKINKFGHARLQQTRSRPEERQKQHIRNKDPKIHVRNIELPIDQQTLDNEIENNGRRNEPVAKPNAGQTLTAAVILGDSLKRDAPPKIPVDLNVPLIPPAISGIAPAFFI